MKKLFFKKAFTLSEVLITLAIIGVIAAITVPMLIADAHKQETITQLQKTYSTLARTTALAIADNGPVETWSIEGLSADGFSKHYLLPYLYVMENKDESEFNYKTLNGKSVSANYGSVFYLNDGSKVSVKTPDISEYGKQVRVYVDINGDKNPNRMGRDVFTFNYWIYQPPIEDNGSGYKISSGSFIPWGINWSRELIMNGPEGYQCNRQSSGDLCAALIVKDGWQIKDDYPW